MKQAKPLADNRVNQLNVCVFERVVLPAYFCV